MATVSFDHVTRKHGEVGDVDDPNLEIQDEIALTDELRFRAECVDP